MRSIARVTVCAALLAAAMPSAQSLHDGTQGTPPAVFKSTAGLVTLTVAVQDSRSRHIKGLEPRDFAVYEDGVQQQVRFFDSTTMPVDLMVLLDRSTSMSDSRAVVREAARGLIGTLRDCDRGAVLTFSRQVTIAQPLTSDRAALLAALDAGVSAGFTALHAALYIALKEFGLGPTTQGDTRRQAIVVISDGEDNASLVSFDDVVAAARQAGVSIYTIRLRSGDGAPAGPFAETERSSRADYQMRVLAQETGALSFFPGAAQLRGVCEAIGDEIASQYSITYEPATPLSNGGFRHVAVQVVGNADLRARTRAGYAARTGARGE